MEMEQDKDTLEEGGSPQQALNLGGYPNENPLAYCDIVERICSHLPFEGLKKARLLNHFWLQATTLPWSFKSQMKFEDIVDLKKLLSISSNMRIVLPFTVNNWSFQGESMIKLMMDKGLCEQHLLQPFWSSMTSLTFANWVKKRFREEVVEVNPGQFDVREVAHYTPTQRSSAHLVNNMLKLVFPNLKKLVIHFPILSDMTGAQIGPRMFPWLEALTHLEVYYEAKKWTGNMATNDPYILLKTNLARSDEELKLPGGVSGGNTLMLRLLDHSPNLTHITVTTGTTLSYKLETWFLCHLTSKTVYLPNLVDLNCSIPLHQDVCRDLMSKPWRLKALHLRSLPGYTIPAKALHDMITNFRDSLRHLELIFIGKGEHSYLFLSGEALYNLESLEVWGWTGDYGFLKGMKKLRKAVVGATDPDRFRELQEYFRNCPMPWLKLEMRTVADYYSRLDQGPLTPFKT